MNATQFNEIAEARIEHCRKTLILKGEEYSRDGDRLWNFKSAARMNDTTPELALWGMMAKHLVSVRDMVNGSGANKVPSKESIDEKVGDAINYLLLLSALMEERRATHEG